MMGSAAAGEAFYGKLRAKSQALGHVVSPDDAALALRGLRTLAVRLNQETSSCLEVVRFLSQRSEIAHILCPMLAQSPGHALWSRDFTGGCGLFSFVLKGRDEAARARFVDALQLFCIGYSWGGYESLVIPFDPARARSATSWPPTGWDPADRFGVRLSIGLEDPADLIADLERGLAAMDGS
jgi:cystathionine beta-lyase